ncbi:e1fb92d0-a088-4127-b796-d078646f61e8 [Sclerotinia trifoliorum]|uniref:E1fb92d0-a088-4127-b796-d078646f61e8 n=1 Tax=Sclerotinia trifoliorum TaxID=28548 RepID=A0A8H2ZRV3_9HELO|nr:e1fb92d0-a088-4127-b796-d078646f61e8 [Sclerotinia trifoliorum]
MDVHIELERGAFKYSLVSSTFPASSSFSWLLQRNYLDEPVEMTGRIPQNDFYFLQREIKTDTHARTSREWYICGLVSRFHLFRIPTIRIKFCWGVPDLGIVVNMMNANNHYGSFGNAVTTWDNYIGESGTTWLVGGIVETLSFFDESPKELKRVCKIWCPFCILSDIVVNKFLKQAFLIAGI